MIAPLGGGPDAGAEAGGRVIGVGTGGDDRKAFAFGQRPQDVEQLCLAEVTTVAVVGPVAGPGHLVGARSEVPHSQFLSKAARRQEFASW